MVTVYKYNCKVEDVIEINLPKFAQILRVDMQNEETDIVSIWALVDPEAKYTETKRIRLAGTGHPVNEHKNRVTYINTFHIMKKKLWFHAFELND